MTPHGKDPSADDDPDNGILDDVPSVETSGIGLMGMQTAHVNIALPSEEEDDDDDVVEGDIAFEGGFVTIELPAMAAAEGDDLAEDGDADANEGAAIEATAADEESTGDDESTADDLSGAEVVVEELASEERATQDLAPEDLATESLASADLAVADTYVEDAETDDVPVDEVELTGFEPTGFEPTPAASEPVASETHASDADDVDDEYLEAPVDDAPDEKETTMNDETDRAAQPAERREVARATQAEAPVLVSRRIGDLADVAERETSDLLTADRLLDPAQVTRPEPEGVWQHLLYSVSGGKLNIGDSKRARARKAMDRRIAAPLPGGGARFVAIVSRKGGVGKTTITTLLGQALADARDDRVIAVDANPDRGTLAERIARRSGRTVRDLVRERENLRGYNDVSAIVARDETRLDVLASDTDPRIAEAFSGDEYRAVAEVAAHYYSVVLTDTGTGIVHSVMGATLERADRLVVVAGQSIDEARLASETLTWLEANGYEDHVRSAIVVLNMSSPGTPPVRQDELEAHFRTRVRDVLRVPYDPQLATGGAIVFRDLQPATRAAARELAAKVVEGLQSVSTAA
ncbi:ATPase (fragment) [Microbacterium sp. C448]|uniref:MinD/ParA family ATP-binding protein n=1 Tax=Microbacterium TaxID=33882 RepID=UPI0003DE25B0